MPLAVKAETAWLVFVVAALAAALALGCGQVEAIPRDSGQLEEAAAGGRGGAAGGELGFAVDAGAAGAAGAHQVDAQAAPDLGPHVGASTARACAGTFVGTTTAGVCGQIAGPNGGYQCEVGCSSSAADNAAGCVFYGVTYCVSSCAACQL